MPEICFYEPWTYQLALPEKIEAYLKFAKKKESAMKRKTAPDIIRGQMENLQSFIRLLWLLFLSFLE